MEGAGKGYEAKAQSNKRPKKNGSRKKKKTSFHFF